MSNNRFYQRISMLLPMVLLPYFAFANHGLEALGEVIQMILIIYAVISFVSLMAAIHNLNKHKVWIRVLNIIVLIPILIAILSTLGSATSFFLLLWLILNIIIIVKSRRKIPSD